MVAATTAQPADSYSAARRRLAASKRTSRLLLAEISRSGRQVTQADLDVMSTTDALAAFGYTHRKADDFGNHEILAAGVVVHCAKAWETHAWLRGKAGR